MQKACPIPLDALQSIKIFGALDQPRNMLSWSQVKQRRLLWNFLRELQISSEKLCVLQPNKKEWICAACITPDDCLDAVDLQIHPLHDFCMDLAQLWKFSYTAPQLLKMNITYNDFCKCGLTPEIMYYFGFTLSSWIELGFRSTDLTPDHEHVFALPYDELKTILTQVESNVQPSR